MGLQFGPQVIGCLLQDSNALVELEQEKFHVAEPLVGRNGGRGGSGQRPKHHALSSNEPIAVDVGKRHQNFFEGIVTWF